MSHVHVVAVGTGTTEPVARGVRELGTLEVAVVGTREERRLVADLVEPLGVSCRWEPLATGGVHEILEAVRRIVPSDPVEAADVLVNLSAAARHQALGLRLGSLATGAQAIRVGPDGVERLPRLWLDVEFSLEGPDERILKALAAAGGEEVSLAALADGADLPRDEVARRIRGRGDRPGLETEGLVDVVRTAGRPRLGLTGTGALLAGRLGRPEDRASPPVTAHSPTR